MHCIHAQAINDTRAAHTSTLQDKFIIFEKATFTSSSRSTYQCENYLNFLVFNLTGKLMSAFLTNAKYIIKFMEFARVNEFETKSKHTRLTSILHICLTVCTHC